MNKKTEMYVCNNRGLKAHCNNCHHANPHKKMEKGGGDRGTCNNGFDCYMTQCKSIKVMCVPLITMEMPKRELGTRPDNLFELLNHFTFVTDFNELGGKGIRERVDQFQKIIRENDLDAIKDVYVDFDSLKKDVFWNAALRLLDRNSAGFLLREMVLVDYIKEHATIAAAQAKKDKEELINSISLAHESDQYDLREEREHTLKLEKQIAKLERDNRENIVENTRLLEMTNKLNLMNDNLVKQRKKLELGLEELSKQRDKLTDDAKHLKKKMNEKNNEISTLIKEKNNFNIIKREHKEMVSKIEDLYEDYVE